jgi:hypothetical protein
MKTERSKAAVENKESTCADNLTLPLIFDLIGPFVVQLEWPVPDKATIFAPFCEDHHANLMTDAQDISLCGSKPPLPTSLCGTQPTECGNQVYNYSLNGPEPSNCFSLCDPDHPQKLLRVPLNEQLDPATYHLKMIVPLPNKIVSLRPEQIWIHRNDSNQWIAKGCKDSMPTVKTAGRDPDNIVNSHRARGLRFIYDECMGCPTVTQDTGAEASVGLDQLCAVARGIQDVITSHYSMTLRYASLHSAAEMADPDDAYADAYSCFEHIRDIVYGLPTWRVDFFNPNNSVSPGSFKIDQTGANPHDCLSPNVIVQNHDDPASE